MDSLPSASSIAGIILTAQDAGKAQNLFTSSVIEGAVVKAQVVGLAGDKAILNVMGEKILADAPSVPLTVGQTLNVQVKTDGSTIQLKVVSSSQPQTSPKNVDEQLANLDLPQTQKARDLMQLMNNLKVEPDAETFRETLPLMSDKPTSSELKSAVLLQQSDMEAEPGLFNSLKTFFDAQNTQEIPQALAQQVSIPQKIENSETLQQSIKQVTETYTQPVEAKLATLSSSLDDLEKALQQFQQIPQDALAENSGSLNQLFQAVIDGLPKGDSTAALLQNLKASIPAQAEQSAAGAQGVVNENPDAAVAALKSSLQQVSDNIASLQKDPLTQMQNSATQQAAQSPVPPSVQNAVSQAMVSVQSHQVANALLTNQTPPVISVPIPLTMNGKNFVGYLHITSEQDRKKFEQNLAEGTFTLNFSVKTDNLGTVGAKIQVHQKVLDGIFQVKGGDEKKFIEQNTDKLIKRLEPLPFKVRSIEARIGETGNQGMGWNPGRTSGGLDIRV